MAKRSRGPHPLAIASSRTAMLILDMISDFDFPDGPAVLRAARRIAPHIVRLKARAAAAKVPVIYVNDNLGAWRSDSRALLRQCQRSEAPGREVVEMIAPTEADFIILKARHSGFYATPLAALLESAKAKRLIITGVSSHQCVLFTANDAHLREYEMAVPRDCIGSPSTAQTQFAVRYFRSVLSADVRPSGRIRVK